jgi:hypothetical protein
MIRRKQTISFCKRQATQAKGNDLAKGPFRRKYHLFSHGFVGHRPARSNDWVTPTVCGCREGILPSRVKLKRRGIALNVSRCPHPSMTI